MASFLMHDNAFFPSGAAIGRALVKIISTEDGQEKDKLETSKENEKDTCSDEDDDLSNSLADFRYLELFE